MDRDLERPLEAVESGPTEGKDAARIAATTSSSDDSLVPEPFWTPAEERKLKLKLDVRLLPILIATYFFSALDRASIGNAKTAGMNQDLGIKDAEYQWLLTLFYIAYVFGQGGVLGYRLFRPSRWIAACIFVWGLASTLQAAAYNWQGLMACRFFMGLAEASYGTGMILYLSFFYRPDSELGVRFAIYFTGGAISSAVAGSIAYGLMKANTAVEAWKLLFIVEGVPTVLCAGLVFVLLPDSVETCSFFTEREKAIATARLFKSFRAPDSALDHREASSTTTRNEGQQGSGLVQSLAARLNWGEAKTALVDPLNYLTSILFFCANVGYSAIPVYLPTLIQGMGYSALRAQAFSAPPYLVAFVVAILIVWLSDRAKARGLIVVFLTLVGAISYILVALLKADHARYGATYLVTVSLYSFIPVLYLWLINSNPHTGSRSFALIILGVIGQCGPFLGTRLFPAKQGPRYSQGMWTLVGLLLFASLASLATTIVLYKRNKRRAATQAAAEAAVASATSGAGRTGTTADEKASAGRKQLPFVYDDDWQRRADVAIRGKESLYFRYSL